MGSLRVLAEETAAEIRAVFPMWDDPVALVQVGTGFCVEGLYDGELASCSLSGLRSMPDEPSPAGHPLRLHLAACGDHQVLVACGRRHLYEGFGALPCVLPVCAAAMLGVKDVILLSASTGSLREELKPGTWVAVTDCINNLGTSPLVGNTDLGSELLPDMTQAFSQVLLSEIINAGAGRGMCPRLGTYQADIGPQLASPAEAETARRNGADVLGRSIALETIAACAMGCRVAAFSLVTCRAASDGARPVPFSQVAETACFCSPPMMRALRLFLLRRKRRAQELY